MNTPLRWLFVSTGLVCAGAVHAAAPVANDDSYQTGQGQMMTIAAPGVLANDTDLEDDPLTASLVSNISIATGTLTFNADGSFTFDPDGDYFGTDSFSYQANGGGEASNVAVVTLTVTSSYDPGAGGGGGGYGSGAPSPSLLALLGLAALHRRGLKASKRRAISP